MASRAEFESLQEVVDLLKQIDTAKKMAIAQDAFMKIQLEKITKLLIAINQLPAASPPLVKSKLNKELEEAKALMLEAKRKMDGAIYQEQEKTALLEKWWAIYQETGKLPPGAGEQVGDLTGPNLTGPGFGETFEPILGGQFPSEEESKKDEKNKKATPFIIGGILFLLIIIVLAIILMKQRKKSKK